MLENSFSFLLLRIVIFSHAILFINMRSIEWVQIVDRRNENGESPTAEDLAAAAFHKAMMVDRITSEKAVRVGKMLNESLTTSLTKISEGSKKMETLGIGGVSQAVSNSSTRLNFPFKICEILPMALIFYFGANLRIYRNAL